MKIRFTTSQKFLAVFIVGGALGWMLAEPIPDLNSPSLTTTFIRPPFSWTNLLDAPFLLFAYIDFEFLTGLRAFLLGGTIGCFVLFLSPILFGSGASANNGSGKTEKIDY